MEEKVYLPYMSKAQSVTEGNEAGTQTEQEPGDRGRNGSRGNEWWLADFHLMACLSCCPIYPETPTQVRHCPQRTGVLCKLWMKKTVHRCSHEPRWWKHFLHKISSSLITLTCVKLVKLTTTTTHLLDVFSSLF